MCLCSNCRAMWYVEYHLTACLLVLQKMCKSRLPVLTGVFPLHQTSDHKSHHLMLLLVRPILIQKHSSHLQFMFRSDILKPQGYPLTGPYLWINQFWALFIKRVIHTRRNLKVGWISLVWLSLEARTRTQ